MKAGLRAAAKWPAPLALAALTAFFYRQVLWGGKIFVFVDASRFFYPFWKWGGSVLRQGLLPLWNPDVQFGTPYLADPQMALTYPPWFLGYSLLPPTDAFAWLVVLHHYWALLGFWVWARHERFGMPAALLGTLAFGFSLHVVCSSWTPVALFTLSWVPWIFLAAQRLWEGRAGAWLPLSLALAFQAAAGYQVLSYLTLLGLLAHLSWRSLRPWPKKNPLSRLGWLPRLCLAGLPALFYNLAWLLPFLELKGFSNYGGGPSYIHPLGFADLATALCPFFQGHPLLSGYHGPHYWIGTYYLGLPVIALLAAAGLGRVPFLRTSPGLFLLFTVLSMGETLYLGGWLKKVIPGYSLVIRSGFWLPLVVLFAARLAMESAEFFFRKRFWKPENIRVWILAWLAVYGAAFLLKPPQFPALFLGSLLLGLTAGAAAWFTPRWRWGFLVLGLALSLGGAASSLNILLDRSYYGQPPAVLASLQEPGRIFFSPGVLKDSGRLEGDSMPDAYEGAKQDLYPDWPLVWGLQEAEVYDSLYLAGPANWIWTSLDFSARESREVMDYLSVRYLIGKNRFAGLKPLGLAGDNPLFENPSSLPKWFSVRHAETAGDLAKDLRKAASPGWRYSRDAFVQDPARKGEYSPRDVRESAPTPQRVEISAPGRGRALLASSETAYPGWKARVEGKPRTLETVNHVFRGLFLEDGESRASMAYAPDSFRLGLFFALLALGVWAGAWLGRLGDERP